MQVTSSSSTPCQAMILAAGRGERMRPLTDHTPKPLLAVRGKPLMQWPMEALGSAGFSRQLVNTAWLGDQISSRFGMSFSLSTGSSVQLQYSHEGVDFGGALETAGGICRALPQLADVFWVVAGDVFAPEFVFSQMDFSLFMKSDKLAHLWLVPNPAHNLQGDFGITPDGLAQSEATQKYTFSTIALYRRELFEAPYCNVASGNPQGIRSALAPLLRAAMTSNRVSAQLYHGAWTDVGTPERLSDLNRDRMGAALPLSSSSLGMTK